MAGRKIRFSPNSLRAEKEKMAQSAPGVTAAMRTTVGILLGLAFLVDASPAQAYDLFLRGELNRVNRCLAGQILDFTHNHGRDNRIWSNALCAKRDMYVYVPPNFDRAKKYPLAIFLHGATQDEQFFL